MGLAVSIGLSAIGGWGLIGRAEGAGDKFEVFGVAGRNASFDFTSFGTGRSRGIAGLAAGVLEPPPKILRSRSFEDSSILNNQQLQE